jgi:basic membrane protein A
MSKPSNLFFSRRQLLKTAGAGSALMLTPSLAGRAFRPGKAESRGDLHRAVRAAMGVAPASGGKRRQGSRRHRICATENVSNTDYERVMREYAEAGNKLILGEVFGVEDAARTVAKPTIPTPPS